MQPIFDFKLNILRQEVYCVDKFQVFHYDVSQMIVMRKRGVYL